MIENIELLCLMSSPGSMNGYALILQILETEQSMEKLKADIKHRKAIFFVVGNAEIYAPKNHLFERSEL